MDLFSGTVLGWFKTAWEWLRPKLVRVLLYAGLVVLAVVVGFILAGRR
jgi:hypothetical protein